MQKVQKKFLKTKKKKQKNKTKKKTGNIGDNLRKCSK